MSSQHLSDEAIAAFADGVLSGSARDRAARHSVRCPECAAAVAVQREAVWALRAAPAPSLPGGLLDRLRSVPVTTPLPAAPTSSVSAIGADGSALFAAFAPLAAAAFAPTGPSATRAVADATARRSEHSRLSPVVLTAAAVAAAGLLTVASGAANVHSQRTAHPAGGGSAGLVQPAGSTGSGPAVVTVNARVRIGP